MARTAVTVTTLTAGTGTTEPAGTNADPTNGHLIDTAGLTGHILIRCANTNGTARNAVIKAGANPPALSAGQGDLTVSVPATTGVVWFGPLESARFRQSDGSIYIDLGASFAGTVTAYRVPRSA